MHAAMEKFVAAWADLDYWEAVFFLGLVVFFLVIYRLHRSDETKFRFEQLFSDDVTGEASVKKLIGVGAFGVHSWATARYCAFTVLDERVISLLALYGLLWAGVLMLGKGFERLLESLAGVVAKKFGVTDSGGGDGTQRGN